ncbi:hypothetical protein AZE42_05915 [Rhizopogon vesiculosus]|uniref:TEA domain-containing protein n=1 Tax=Rhizopogon vesiculosus TaxID=180088 RepID=A0A1J8R098_9AGAM|nr:hypothetical protein AZE42_05915 [Rhizopogon vesiculosus]
MTPPGLQEYEPVDSRETRILGRFPMRNRFISEYIFRTTGKYRSSKQIGSRLQQLRDTSEGRELIDSLTRCYLTRSEAGSSRTFSPHHHVFGGPSSSPSLSSISCDSLPSDDSSTSSSTDSPASSAQYSPIMPSSKHNQLPDSRTPVYIDILPEPSSWSNSSSSRPCAPSSSYRSPQGAATSHSSSNMPRRMRDIDSTVTFVSPSAVTGKSSYIVLLDGAPIHSEDTKLECVGPYPTGSINPSSDGPLLYSTTLVPKFWETLCKSPDPTVYTIIQDVYRAPDPAPLARYPSRPRPVLIFSAIYHFRYPVSVRTPPSSMPPHLAYQATSPLPNNAHAYSDSLNPIRSLPFQNYRTTSGFSDQGRFQLHDAQNRLDEPFVLDVGLGDFSIDDYMVDIPDSSELHSKEMLVQSSSSSSFPKDIRNYIM